MNYLEQIGKRVGAYRRNSGITLRDFAAETGISTATLSELERGIGNPSLHVLETLAAAIGVPVASFFQQEISNMELVCRREERQIVKYPQANHLYTLLAAVPLQSHIQLLLSELQKGMASNPEPQVHAREEIAYVMQGSVYIRIEHDEILLHCGDSIRILPGRAHCFFNPFDETAEILFAKETG